VEEMNPKNRGNLMVRSALVLSAIALLALSYWSSPPAVPSWAAEDPNLYWSIGTQDDSSDEFLPGSQPNLTYTIGKSTPRKDWRERQGPGAVYRIEFPLDGVPSPAPLLVIDAFIFGITPHAVEVRINGRRGIFHPQVTAARDVDERDANRHSYAKTEIRVPFDAALLNQGKNTIDIRPSRRWQLPPVRLCALAEKRRRG
jgi:Polysaccharide lyase family 4, domain III